MFPYIDINILYGLLCAVQIDIYGMLVGLCKQTQIHKHIHAHISGIWRYKLAATVVVAILFKHSNV